MADQDPKNPDTPHTPRRTRLIRSFGYAFEGLAYTIRSQRNMRIHVTIAVLVVILGILARLTPLEWVALSICMALVLVGEMLNTAIESMVDLITPEWHPLAKRAKDIGAGMVLLFALLSVVVGCFVFIPALMRLFG